MPKIKKTVNKNKQRSTKSRPLLSVVTSKSNTKRKAIASKNKTYNLRILPDDSSFQLRNTATKNKPKTRKKPVVATKVPSRSLRVSPNELSFQLQKAPLKKKQSVKKNTRTFGTRLVRGLPSILIIIGLAGIAYSSVQVRKTRNPEQPVSFSLTAPKIQESRPAKPKDVSLPRSEPSRVAIKSVGIDYGVKPVGKLADGTMETPGVLESITGWYKYSPTPGEIGPSVIVGHVDSYEGPSVFWRLREVKPGDIVEVARADGKTASFKITALKQFDQANFPTQEVYGNVEKAELRLITCGGTFNKQTQHYTENTVVFATLII